MISISQDPTRMDHNRQLKSFTQSSTTKIYIYNRDELFWYGIKDLTRLSQMIEALSSVFALRSRVTV
jgi:hypothetical protein